MSSPLKTCMPGWEIPIVLVQTQVLEAMQQKEMIDMCKAAEATIQAIPV